MGNKTLNDYALEIRFGKWEDSDFYRFDAGRIEQYGKIFEKLGYHGYIDLDGLDESDMEPRPLLPGKERDMFCMNADRVARCLMKFWFTCHAWDCETLRRPGNWVEIHYWAKNVEHMRYNRGEKDGHVYDGEFLAGYIHFLNMLMHASDSYIRSCIDLDRGMVRIPKTWENTYRYIALPHLYEVELEARRIL
jgi:hypothetical protein